MGWGYKRIFDNAEGEYDVANRIHRKPVVKDDKICQIVTRNEPVDRTTTSGGLKLSVVFLST